MRRPWLLRMLLFCRDANSDWSVGLRVLGQEEGGRVRQGHSQMFGELRQSVRSVGLVWLCSAEGLLQCCDDTSNENANCSDGWIRYESENLKPTQRLEDR